MICVAAMDGERRETAATAEIGRLRRGDPEAVSALIHLHQHRLYRYLLRIVRDPAAAEDLFQQTWLRVVERIGRYDPSRSFDAWLFSVAHNLAIDHLRRKQPEGVGEESEYPASSPHAVESLLSDERAAQVASAMASLPVVYRETLALRFEQEMKLEEIATAAAIPLSTVKSRLRRGLEEMRKRLESKGIGL